MTCNFEAMSDLNSSGGSAFGFALMRWSRSALSLLVAGSGMIVGG